MSGGGVRLFVALDLPPAVVAALVAWRRPLVGEGTALRPLPEASLHVTLCFLGERPAAAVAPLATLVEACAAPVAGIALGEALWLPRRRPRLLAAALDDREEQLGALHDRLLARLVAEGWHEPDARPYLPHVTVARVRGRGAGSRPAAVPAPPPLAFEGAALTLYRSHLGGEGARYEPLARRILA